ncbi:hypothetical protein HO173_012823 [Letharia columbiana]|uniref:MADS-box domain-containing protein n=1 Tax=Letharia columbiana TaxID=112416 RepID=A0A8H6CKW9_9LECA|nr:uncharacterized protein HO173_012823 [Letharia columbiana]KAF6225338.1 hypothetical protein HO173_012823 [Letharia columbiana]
MGRRKIEIKAIKDDRNRSVTFLKRKGGLFKKAHELSVLCSVDVAVIIFGHNKKLYEYSSGDINETIDRFHFYGGAHEHKGPGDFNGGGMDDEDDDEMGTPPLEDPMPREHSLPPHLQNATSYMRNASPPIQVVPNGVPYQRQHTPQAQMISRPGSRNSIPNVRRMSGSVGPGPSHLQQVSQAPQAANGYAYTRQPPSMYNTQAAQGMPVAPHHPQQQAQQAQYYGQLQQAAAPHAQVQQAYLQEQRRQSLPPAFPQHERQQQQQQHMPSPPQPEREPSQDDQSNRLQQPQPAKSRSIFTPIDDSRSLLAQHWGIGKSTIEPKSDIKRENDPHSDARNQASKPTPSSRLQREAPVPKRTNSIEFPPPIAIKHRPIEREETEAQVTTSDTPAKSTEASHSSGTGVVLPPPSPSASAILSAGASGPPNPFARPHPPGGPSQGQSYSSNNNSIETPISALPSRFVADGLLPSPSSFYPEWNFGRSGGDSNLLPSPLNLQTPVMGGSSFRDEDGDRKRKSPDQEGQEAAKRVKT